MLDSPKASLAVARVASGGGRRSIAQRSRTSTTSAIEKLSGWKEFLYNEPVPPGKTVLVVEDDAALRELYMSALVSAGYSVIAVEDGIDALRRVERETPQAVVLDMALPRLGGRDVQRELRARPDTCAIPIVVVSGTDVSDLKESEFASVLKKPIHPEAVVYAVDKCVRRASRAAGQGF